MRITNTKTYVRQNAVCWHATDSGEGVVEWFYLEKARGGKGKYRIHRHQWWAAHVHWDGLGMQPIMIPPFRTKREVIEAIELKMPIYHIQANMEPNKAYSIPLPLEMDGAFIFGVAIRCRCGDSLQAIGQPREELHCASCHAVYVLDTGKCPSCGETFAKIRRVEQAPGAVSIIERWG